MGEFVGITTTIPQEVIWAAGKRPLDLNNLFLASERREFLLERAFRDGYPRTACAWIAGIYGSVLTSKEIDTVVFVTQGDCSNTHALAETLEVEGVRMIPFAFPRDGDIKILENELENLAGQFKVAFEEVEHIYKKLRTPRDLASQIDRMTWKENLISSFENHLWLVTSSDFGGDFGEYSMKAIAFIKEAEQRSPKKERARLGYIGVPPIFPDIYNFIDGIGARVVFNEVQRQFALPFFMEELLTAHSKYTYPTRVFRRIEDILTEIARREIDGIIHYTQSFCFRQIEDLLFRKFLNIPILTIEGESQFELDERTKIRIESFVHMLDEAKR